MRKSILVLVFVSLASVSFAGFGLGVKGGYAQQDSNMERIGSQAHQVTGGSYTSSDGFAFLGFEGLYETAGIHRMGVKIGLELYDNTEIEQRYYSAPYWRKSSLESEFFAIPVTAYYKYAPAETGFHFWIGAGASFGRMQWEEATGTKYNQSKVFGHADGGIEYRWRKFAVGMDLGYVFGAKFDDLVDWKSSIMDNPSHDMSGLRVALAGRFYF
ncbi:hypothetical protein Dip510_001942 [Elusimicrobium posterum]|uniref:hypothetical protein n=1 Tax=Elusimicrobium posterum TaxID=3116653 RepID=UPI003C7173A2